MLKRLKKRMKKEMGVIAGSDKTRVNKEVAKLGHMLSAIKSAALELAKKLKQEKNTSKLSDEKLNEIFWGDFNLESQRYLATIRDLEKEDMQQARATGGSQQDLQQDIGQTQGVKFTGS